MWRSSRAVESVREKFVELSPRLQMSANVETKVALADVSILSFLIVELLTGKAHQSTGTLLTEHAENRMPVRQDGRMQVVNPRWNNTCAEAREQIAVMVNVEMRRSEKLSLTGFPHESGCCARRIAVPQSLGGSTGRDNIVELR